MQNTYVNLQLCSYVYTAEAYDSGKDIFLSFVPLIECVLLATAERSISFLHLQSLINETYKVDMPKATLQKLLENLEQQKKIVFPNKNSVRIVGENFDIAYIENRQKIEQEIIDFFIELRAFLLEKEIDIPREKLKEEICDCIFNNVYEFASFISKDIKPGMDCITGLSYIDDLCDFLLEEKRKNSSVYQSFLKLYYGAIQTSLLNFRPNVLDGLQKNSLNIYGIILDSNFMMRILNLQDEIECVVASDTFKSLKRLGIKCYALESSLNEITGNIKGFLNDSEPYTAKTSKYLSQTRIRFSGLLAAQKRGLKRSDLYQISRYSKLKERLWDDFDIETIEDVIEHDYTEEEIRSLIQAKTNGFYGTKQAEHDLGLIKYCRKKRPKRADDFLNAQWWILTSDIKLAYWNQTNSRGIQECITEAQLSGLIWIKTGEMDNAGFTETMISLASGGVGYKDLYNFIDRVQKYQRGAKEEKLDNLSMAFASSLLRTEDIQRINSNDAIETIIEEKIIVYRNEEENKKKAITLEKMLNAELQQELSERKLNLEILTIDKAITDNRLQQQSAKSEIKDVSIQIIGIDKVLSYYQFSGKRLARLIFVGLLAICIICVSAAFVFDSFDIALIEIISSNSALNYLANGVSFTILLTVLSYTYSMLKVGRPMKWKQLFEHLVEEEVCKFKSSSGIECGEKDKLDQEMGTLNAQKMSLEQKITELDNAYEDLRIRKHILNRKISDITA